MNTFEHFVLAAALLLINVISTVFAQQINIDSSDTQIFTGYSGITVTSFIASSDGNFYISGNNIETQSGEVFLTKLSSDGSIDYELSNSEIKSITSIILDDQTGDIYAIGEYPNLLVNDMVIFGVTTNGIQIFLNTYGNLASSYITGTIKLNSGVLVAPLTFGNIECFDFFQISTGLLQTYPQISESGIYGEIYDIAFSGQNYFTVGLTYPANNPSSPFLTVRSLSLSSSYAVTHNWKVDVPRDVQGAFIFFNSTKDVLVTASYDSSYSAIVRKHDISNEGAALWTTNIADFSISKMIYDTQYNCHILLGLNSSSNQMLAVILAIDGTIINTQVLGNGVIYGVDSNFLLVQENQNWYIKTFEILPLLATTTTTNHGLTRTETSLGISQPSTHSTTLAKTTLSITEGTILNFNESMPSIALSSSTWIQSTTSSSIISTTINLFTQQVETQIISENSTTSSSIISMTINLLTQQVETPITSENSMVTSINSSNTETQNSDLSQDLAKLNVHDLLLSNKIIIIIVSTVVVIMLLILIAAIVCRRFRSKDSKSIRRSRELTKMMETSYATEVGTTSMSTVFGNGTTYMGSDNELALPGFLAFVHRTHFVLNEKIARGGCGEIYLAKSVTPSLKKYGDIIIAKKFTPKEGPFLTSDEEAVFNQEVSIMHMLRNERNIVHLLGYATDPHIILMKYFRIGSLETFLNSRKYHHSKLTSICFAKDISLGLSAIHRAGIVHSDLKAANILIDCDHNNRLFCAITDFGIAQIITSERLMVKSFQVVDVIGGSLAYAAPEVFDELFSNRYLPVVPGQPDYRPKRDMYAFAVILHQILIRPRRLILSFQ